MKLSLALTNYGRYDMLLESFDKVLDDDRISEIVISDDCSSFGIFDALCQEFEKSKYKKVFIYRNEVNVGMSLNKRKAISLCENPWVIIFDSDNIITPAYLDALEKVDELFEHNNEIYLPSFAEPQFDYRAYEGVNYSTANIAAMIKEPMGNCCMNTCNMVVNREYYLETYKANEDHLASDTIWHNYNHLKSGGSFYVVPGMHYFHRVHPGSGFMQDVNKNMDNAEKVRQLIISL